MQDIDWVILVGTLLFIVIYGTYKGRKNKNVTDYLKGGSTAKWWTIGLSVMATQASAITFLSTPGQAFHDPIRSKNSDSHSYFIFDSKRNGMWDYNLRAFYYSICRSRMELGFPKRSNWRAGDNIYSKWRYESC